MARFKRVRMYGLTDFILFGKHDGEQIEDILEDDPGYIVWMYEQDSFGFDDEVIKILEDRKLI